MTGHLPTTIRQAIVIPLRHFTVLRLLGRADQVGLRSILTRSEVVPVDRDACGVARADLYVDGKDRTDHCRIRDIARVNSSRDITYEPAARFGSGLAAHRASLTQIPLQVDFS